MPRHLRYTGEVNSNLRKNSKHLFSSEFALVFYEKSVVYSMIPKNACSTMRLTLAMANGCIEGPKNIDWIHNNNDAFRASLRDLVSARGAFVILRCPYRRLVSTFLDKFVATDRVAWNYQELMNRSVDLETISFEDFVTSLTRPMVLNGDMHWRPQVDFLVYKEYDDYLCVEDFGRACETLLGKYGILVEDARNLTGHGLTTLKKISSDNFSATPVHELSGMRRKHECPDYENMYTKEIRDIVTNLFATDIEMYVKSFGATNLLFPDVVKR